MNKLFKKGKMFLVKFLIIPFRNYKEFLIKQKEFLGSATAKYKWDKVKKYFLREFEVWDIVLTILDVKIWKNRPLFIC